MKLEETLCFFNIQSQWSTSMFMHSWKSEGTVLYLRFVLSSPPSTRSVVSSPWYSSICIRSGMVRRRRSPVQHNKSQKSGVQGRHAEGCDEHKSDQLWSSRVILGRHAEGRAEHKSGQLWGVTLNCTPEARPIPRRHAEGGAAYH